MHSRRNLGGEANQNEKGLTIASDVLYRSVTGARMQERSICWSLKELKEGWRKQLSFEEPLSRI